MSRRRIALGIGANVIDRAVIALIQLLLVPILATHWGVERFGGWAMLVTVPGLLVLADLGFANAAAVRMTMELAQGKTAMARTIIRSATQMVIAACAAVVVFAISASWQLPGDQLLQVPLTSDREMRWAIALMAVYACLIMISGLFIGLLRSHGRYPNAAMLATVTTLLENGLLVLAVVLDHGIAIGALALVTGRAIGLGLIIGFSARLRTGTFPVPFGGSPAVRRELLKPALAAMAIPLATALLLQGTVSALGLVAGAAMVPAFVAARTLSRVGLQGSQVLTTALMADFGGAAARDNRSALNRMFLLVLGTGLAIALPFAAVLALAGPWIVQVWSNWQITASPALMIAIAVSALCGGIWNPLSNLMLAINRQSEFALIYAVLAALGVALTLVLGARLGGTAPALALALVDLTMLGVVGRFALQNWSEGNLASGLIRLLKDELGAIARRLRRS
jgi:O-antigen/teichoic acid export membrane protein